MSIDRFLILCSVFVLAPVVLLFPACSTVVPPTVTRGPSVAIAGERTVSLTANRQVPRIQQSLENAGLATTNDPAAAEYALDVKVGNTRRTKPCGTAHNIAYILREKTGRVLVIKGRGLTGACIPNIFDEMSETLASYF